ncbi:MAG: exonuclease SbcCD subunit D [Chloroflexi bacterium]|nr:exonuclease SbcCD subunit D [Chloroflexota bacterium]
MRVLHTADWHLGRTIRGRSRAAEFEAVLDEVVEIARSEHVDLLLVCGDIWDAASPAPESDRLLFETLRRLIEAKIQVLLLAGNHDSSRKLEAVGRLSDLLGVYTRHEVQRPEDGGVLTIRAGSEIARIACAPWIREGRLVSAEQLVGLSPADTFSSYAEGCGEIYRALCAGFTTETVNLMAGHLFVAGSLVPGLDGSERRLDIGLTYGVPPEMLPGSPQYIALGHVHRPQEIAGAAAPAAYAGSLLQLDFGERGQQKVVRLVEVSPGAPARQRAIPLTSGRPLIELRGPLPEILARAAEAAGSYARVIVEVERPEPGLAARVREEIPTAVDVRLEYEHERALPEPELARLAPRELFVRYYVTQHGAGPAEELTALFDELMEQAAGAP